MRSLSPLAKRVDRLVGSTKWLAAGVAAVFSPLIVHAVGLWMRKLDEYPVRATMFALGASVVVVLCRTDLVNQPWVQRLIGWERRITQSLFSFLLLSPFTNVLSDRILGPNLEQHPRRFLGPSNWIVLASSYVFPAASLLLWLTSWLVLPATLRSLVLGFGVAYHVASGILQWVHGAPELQQLGRKFCVMFLIPANLLVIGAGFAFALDGFTGLYRFALDVVSPLRAAWGWIENGRYWLNGQA